MKTILKSKSFWGAILGAGLLIFDAIPYDWAPWVLGLVACLRVLSTEIREGKAILDAVKKAVQAWSGKAGIVALLALSAMISGCPHADWAGAGCVLEKNDKGDYEYVCSGKVLAVEFEGELPGGTMFFKVNDKRIPLTIKANDMGVPKCR